MNNTIENSKNNLLKSQFIYKYRTINSTIEILKNNSLWFSKPNNFNDPFDCQVFPDTNNSKEEIKTYLMTNQYKCLNKTYANKLVTLINPCLWNNIIEKSLKELVNEYGICSFTKRNNNILMWSHYTDSHEGVCLKFDINKDPCFFGFPILVNYQKDYPKYNIIKNRDEIFTNIIFTKSIEWVYEEELRVFKIDKTGLIPFKKECLVEIIFGCNSSEFHIHEIMKLASINNFNIKFKKANKKHNEFGLNIINL